MIMTEFQILSEIRNNGGRIDYVKLLNRGQKYPPFQPSIDHDRLESLKEKGYITGSFNAYSIISIEPAGNAYLDFLVKEQSEHRKQFAHDWKIAIISIIGGALLSEPLTRGFIWLFTLFLNILQ